jgi:hypothetical protein
MALAFGEGRQTDHGESAKGYQQHCFHKRPLAPPWFVLTSSVPLWIAPAVKSDDRKNGTAASVSRASGDVLHTIRAIGERCAPCAP